MLTSPHTKAKPYNVGYMPTVDAPSVDTADDTRMSKEDFLAKLDRGEEAIRQGKGIRMLPEETLAEFLNRRHGCTR
jgi:hypothetical protein